MLRIDQITVGNYRCFGPGVELRLEADCTVLFAENAGGKTALLNALAFVLARRLDPPPLRLRASVDVRQVRTSTGALEPAGACVFQSSLTVDNGKVHSVFFASRSWRPAGDVDWMLPGIDWPIIAFYGTQRLGARARAGRPKPEPRRRTDGYIDCLDPRATEARLLAWMFQMAVADTQRRQRGEPVIGLFDAVCAAMARATEGVKEVWYDLAASEPRVRFHDGSESAWSQLSDGYHSFLALVADIARRAVTLNDHLGAEAPALTTGVVLIDEIDLHLHPRWQRRVVAGLRRAFPKMQFVLTTHSPQVLGSVENRQVRRLVNYKVEQGGIFVQDRDTNAILADAMGDDERSSHGNALLRELYSAIDTGKIEVGERKLTELRAVWGPTDPAIVRAEAMLDWRR